MRNRIISILMSAIMFVTVFSIPFTSFADTTGTESSEENLVIADDLGEEETITDIEAAEVKLDKTSYTYTGSSIVPKVTVVLEGTTLVKDTDYSVTVSNNVNKGTATVVVNGIGAYEGSVTKTFTITAASLSKATVKTQYTSYGFAKKYIQPKTTVTLNGKTLVWGRDYSIKFKNNYYPGTGTITVTGKGNYSGTRYKDFYISQAQGLKVKKYGSTSLTLKWNKNSYVTGYKLYKYNFNKDKWQLYKTIKGNKNTSYKVTGLGAGYGYNFKIRTYYKKGLKTYYGPSSATLRAPTYPSKPSISSISQDARLKMTVKYSQRQGSGYQVRVSTSSKFSDYYTYKVSGKYSTSKLIENLKDQKTYYVKVRGYRSYDGKTVYGAWSDVKKTTASDTGWVNTNGKKYYYVNKVPAKGTKTISGNQYYFDTTTGEMRGVSSTMWSKVKDATSNTKYLVAMSRDLNRVVVYTGSKGDWKPLYYWKCTDGAKGTRTPGGSFLTPTTKSRLGYIGGHIEYTCWYATRVTKSVYFHSVLYYPRSKTRIQDGRLGVSVSHGCIRLALENAKWMYDNIKPGTRVIIY